jgi:signal transduction histidine kinase
MALVLTGVTVRYTLATTEAKDLARFDNRVQRTEDLIRSRLDTYVLLLQSWAFQFASETPVRPADCLALIKRLNLERGYPGIAKLGFSPRVRKGDEETLSKWLSAVPGKPVPLSFGPAQEEAYPIVILEPHEEGRALYGFDCSTLPSLKAAMVRARDEGVPAASRKVDLQFGKGSREDPGILIFVPVYRTGVVPDTLAGRKEAFEGFVHGSFRLAGLLAHLFLRQDRHGVGFDVYSGERTHPGQFLFSSFDSSERSLHPLFERTGSMEVAGENWTVHYRTVRPFGEGSESSQAFVVLLLGLAGGGALFWSTLSQERAAAKLRGSEERVRELNQSLEQRVRERTADLEVANKALEAFSYSVSHDLRGPLRSLDGFSQLLMDRQGASLDEQGRNYLQRILTATKEMSLLVDGFLELARVARREMKEERVDLSGMAASILQDLRARNPDRPMEWTIQPGIVGKGDAQLLRIALDNLIQNAWKFTQGCPDPRISVGTESGDGGTALYVRDNGAGFDMTHADRLFKPFERLHTADEFPGSGIGLATVQRIIDRHAGKVWAVGTVGRGATFYFTLGGAIESNVATELRPRPAHVERKDSHA